MSFRHLIGDSFLDYFHFDSKFFRTILPLLFNPGWLTLEYMKGRRKSYVEPFKLFLVISVIYFLLLPFSKESEPEKISPKRSNSNLTLKDNNKSPLEKTKFSLNGIQLGKKGRDSIRKEIDTIGLQGYVDKHFGKKSLATRIFIKQVLKIAITTGQSFTTILEHTASKLIFLFIPVLAALLKLFYIRRKRLFFEHLIFSLHLHSFIFLIFILNLLIELIFPINMFIIVMIILVYGFFALKKYYGQGFGKTLAKMLLISLSYLNIAIPLFFLVLLLVAVLTF